MVLTRVTREINLKQRDDHNICSDKYSDFAEFCKQLYTYWSVTELGGNNKLGCNCGGSFMHGPHIWNVRVCLSQIAEWETN